MNKFHNTASDSANHTFWKAYSVVGTAFASRSSEPHKIHFWEEDDKTDGIIRQGNGDFKITYKRSKQRGKKTPNVDTFCIINGIEEKLALQKYWDAFPAIPVKAANGDYNGRTGRFFRYLKEDSSTQKLVSTIKPIGKEPCRNVGKNIALFLGLSHPEVQIKSPIVLLSS